MSTLKGQNLRISWGSTVFAEATNCVVTITNNVESTPTKDDAGMSDKPERVSIGWGIQVDTLSVADASSLLNAMKSGTKLTVAFDETSTTDNQTQLFATYGRYGDAFITDMTLQFNDRTFSAKNLQLTGTGKLNKFETS